jgi:hypothetical protein
MAPIVVQITFKIGLSGKEYEQAIAPLAQSFADVAGLQWKIWLLNESTHDACELYLFEDEESANAFLSGPLMEHIQGAPIIADLQAAQLNVLTTLTEITRGPIPT